MGGREKVDLGIVRGHMDTGEGREGKETDGGGSGDGRVDS